MTWSARITDKDGQVRVGYNACESCRHGGKQCPPPCNITRVAGSLASVLTAVDVGADGHMASGSAELRCNGYEPQG